jgi:hypothetical protein
LFKSNKPASWYRSSSVISGIIALAFMALVSMTTRLMYRAIGEFLTVREVIPMTISGSEHQGQSAMEGEISYRIILVRWKANPVAMTERPLCPSAIAPVVWYTPSLAMVSLVHHLCLGYYLQRGHMHPA